MVAIEMQARKRERRMRLQRALTLALFRLTTQNPRLVFAPTDELLKYLKLPPHPSLARRVSQAYQRMEQKGLLERKRQSGKLTVSLSTKGQLLAEKLDKTEKVILQKPKRWDGKWRIIIFDVWEYRRGVRDKFRQMLVKAGFFKLQNSVWVYPYDCEELLVFLRSDLHLGKSVIYIIAEGIEHDGRLRDHYGL